MDHTIHDICVKRGSKILIKVRASAKQNSIDGWGTIGDKKYLKVSIKAAPEKGKANKMLIAYLAENLNLLKSDIRITMGAASGFKTITLLD